MAYKIKARFQDTDEEIDLIEESYNNNGALLYYYHDSDGNYLRCHLPPYNKYPAHSLGVNMGALLGDRMVLVVKKEED